MFESARMRMATIAATLATAARLNELFSTTPSTPRIVQAQRPFHERYRYKPHNGKQEMARRKRHMERCGVWRYPGALFGMRTGGMWYNNSHGEVCKWSSKSHA